MYPPLPLADPGQSVGRQTSRCWEWEYALPSGGGKKKAQVMGETARGHGRLVEGVTSGGLGVG